MPPPPSPCTHGCCWLPVTYNSRPCFTLCMSGRCHCLGHVPRGWDTPGRAGCARQPRGLLAAPGSSVPTQPPTATNTFFSRTQLAAHALTHPRHRAHLCCLPARRGHPRSGDRPRPRTHSPQAVPTHVSPPCQHSPGPLSTERSKGLLLIFVKPLIRRLSSHRDGGDVAAGGGGHHSSTPPSFFLRCSAPLGAGADLPGEAASGCPPRERVIHVPLTKHRNLVLLQKNKKKIYIK